MSARGWERLLSDANLTARMSTREPDPDEREHLRAEAEWLLGEAVAARGLLLTGESSNECARGRLASPATESVL